MKSCKVISHTITLEYECPEKEETYKEEIKNPYIGQGQYFEDWQYRFVRFKCPHCGNSHMFEI